jgi:hypothetical protein
MKLQTEASRRQHRFSEARFETVKRLIDKYWERHQ